MTIHKSLVDNELQEWGKLLTDSVERARPTGYEA
jgi:hypothetical protein